MVRQARARGWSVVGTHLTRAVEQSVELDVRDPVAVAAAVEEVAPHRIIHTAYRQDDRDATFRGAVHVAAAAKRVRARLVHVSTDVVFSGRLHRPYRETDRMDPVTAYGRAKADAEREVARLASGAAIVRTSLLLPGRYEQTALNPEYAFFDDEIRCPAAVEDVASALIEVAHLPVSGPLHVAGADALSRYQLACLFARAHGRPADGVPRTSGAASAGRPADCRLDSSLARRLVRTRLRGARELFG